MKRRLLLQAPAVLTAASVVPSLLPSTGEAVSVRALVGKTHYIDVLPWNVWHETPDIMFCGNTFADETNKCLTEILDNEVMPVVEPKP